jgi:hypothetical protein
MSKHSRLSRSFTQTLVASSLALVGFAAFAADFPIGTYSIDATKPNLTFDGKGRFRVVQGAKLLVSGTYSVKGDQIEVTDTKGPWACTADGQRSGTYHWNYEKSVLNLSKVSDACQDRVGSLAAVKWTKQS